MVPKKKIQLIKINKMKIKITLLLVALVFGFNTTYGQDNQEECMNHLSIFSSYAKNKKYAEAYESWLKVRTDCSPAFNRNVYVAGEKILKDKIEKTKDTEQTTFVKDLIKLYNDYNTNFSSKYPKGEMYADIGNITYKYRKQLNATNQDIYSIFDKGYTEDLENFSDYLALYTYFKMAVKLYDAGAKTPTDSQKLFDKYDDVNDKVEIEVGKASSGLNKLIEKEESGATLTKREGSFKRRYTGLLKAYDQITSGVNQEIGDRATCEVLIPLYQKDFEANKSDAKWLQRAINKMGQKECTDDPLFEKLVIQKNTIEPDAGVAYYLGFLNEKKGKTAEADKYYKQSLDLETDPIKRGKLVFRMAEKSRKRGAYAKARGLYRQALTLNRSSGLPHLRIATMYAKSANNCGTDAFNKRAVYWAAANEAAKAGRVDGRLKKTANKSVARYNALAPDKTMIFTKGNAGQTIKIGCWIGTSVTVPK